MNEFEQMNTFFTIASVGFIIFVLFGILIGYYFATLLKKLNAIIDDAKAISDDAKDIANELHDEVMQARSAISGIISFFGKNKKPKKKRVAK